MELKVEYVPIELIKPYENNPRMNDGAIDKVAQSIKEFGFQQPIVCDKNNVIIVGHTRLKAAEKLGIKKVPVCFTDMSEKKAAAYRLADNKVHQFSIWDNKKLLEELDFIGDEFFTGFDTSDVFDILDEENNSVLGENAAGLEYEIVFRSSDKEKIEKIRLLWDGIDSEQNISGGNQREAAGG